MHTKLLMGVALAASLSAHSALAQSATDASKQKSSRAASDVRSSVKSASAAGAGSTTSNRTVAASGTVAAPALTLGSAQQSAEAGYLQVSALPFDRASITIETKANSGASVSRDYSASYWRTIDTGLDFHTRIGKIALRPHLELASASPTVSAGGARAAATAISDAAALLRVGYLVMDNLEVGGGLGVGRSYVEAPEGNNNETVKTLTSAYTVGPYGLFTLPVEPMRLELGAFLNYTTKASERTQGNTTTKSSDNYVWALGASATAVINLTSQLDYGAGVQLGYTTETLKQNNGEINTKATGFGFYPALLRFKF